MQPICLLINKYGQTETIVYYKVEDCLNNALFYIGIDFFNKILLFFESNNFKHLIGTINLDNNPIASIAGIQENIVLMISAKATQAIQERNYPDSMNIVTH